MKKSEIEKGQNQHFVPEVYLNNFSYDEVGNLYSIKIKPKIANFKIKKFNKSAICYKPNNYRFNQTETRGQKVKTDSNFIENNLFDYENEFVNSISEKINAKKNINLLEAEELMRVLLSIKGRNQHLKKLFQDSQLMIVQLKKKMQEIKESTIGYKIKYPDKYDSLLSIIENEVIKKIEDKSETSDLYNDQILRAEERKDPNLELYIKEMAKSKFLVYCTDDSKPFLTSDNPGFTEHEGNKIGNLSLGSAKAFAFPISKTRLLVITPFNRDGNELIIKRIKYIDAPEKILNYCNIATIINTEERIFSNSKEYLEELLERFDFEKNEYKK